MARVGEVEACEQKDEIDEAPARHRAQGDAVRRAFLRVCALRPAEGGERYESGRAQESLAPVGRADAEAEVGGEAAETERIERAERETQQRAEDHALQEQGAAVAAHR